MFEKKHLAVMVSLLEAHFIVVQMMCTVMCSQLEIFGYLMYVSERHSHLKSVLFMLRRIFKILVN